MHYYPFNIGDYHTHTSHLDPLEDIAYRRLLDWCYLHESILPSDINEIARLIRMRTHEDCIAVVLREFFVKVKDGYHNEKAAQVIEEFKLKSKKAKRSAEVRWAKTKGLADANALKPQCDGNANQEPRTKNQEPIKKKIKSVGFARPSQKDVAAHAEEKGLNLTGFFDYYESNGWKVGKNSMKNWKAAASGWDKRSKNYESNKKPSAGKFGPAEIYQTLAEIATNNEQLVGDDPFC